MKWWSFFIVMTVLMVVFYLLNPSGTDTWDPRARILGFKTYHIPSASMSPTLVRGDYILVKTFAYSSTQPEITDVVVYKTPTNRNQDFVGRVLARAGDSIAVIDSIAVVNGEPREEDYILKSSENCRIKNFDQVVVPEGSLFIMGDNRCNSLDSRMFGFVSDNKLIGQVFYIWMSDKPERVGRL